MIPSGPAASTTIMADAVSAGNTGQFGWFLKIGATPQAVAVLNDQPVLFTILIVVLIGITLEVLLIWYIHVATMKPEQKKKKQKGGKDAQPPAKK